MVKEQKIIAEGKFKAGICWDFCMPYTDEVDEDEMEDKLAALNGQEGRLVFVPKKL